MALEGRVFLTKEGEKFVLYLPAEIFTDPEFPFKGNEELNICILPEEKSINCTLVEKEREGD